MKVSINTNAPPDKRSYKVDFSLFESLAPNFIPQVDLNNSIKRLSKGLTSMGFAARRVAREIGSRTGWTCEIAEAHQVEFLEPLFRTNEDLMAQVHPEWDEAMAWSELAEHYRHVFA